MPKITDAKILIIATDGYERSELRVPYDSLKAKGADVKIASLKAGEIKSWVEGNWGDTISADLAIADAKVDDYDALVIPGGVINPDKLRVDEATVTLVRDFVTAGKVTAAICHGPWLLVEADVLDGREATSFKSIKTDMENAGAEWSDKEVVTDQGLITSRSPKDLPAFVAKIVEEIEEGRHSGKKAA